MSINKNYQEEIIGKTFGSLTGISFSHFNRKSFFNYKCSCGNMVVASGTEVKAGKKKSCGCLVRDSIRERWGKHMDTHSSLYDVWRGIKKRCLKKDNYNYHNYGGRGITMYEGWVNDYSAFKKYIDDFLGPKPSPNHSIDRENNDGNYEPGNLRWATQKVQGNNRRDNTILSYNGQSLTATQWAEKIGCSDSAIFNRIKKGWSIEKIVTLPPRGKRPINQLTTDGVLIKKWKSLNDIINNNSNIFSGGLHSVLGGHNNTYRGYKWEYAQ